jgi:hypothetical protein
VDNINNLSNYYQTAKLRCALNGDHQLFSKITRVLLTDKLGLAGQYYRNQALARDCGISGAGNVSLLLEDVILTLVFRVECWFSA